MKEKQIKIAKLVEKFGWDAFDEIEKLHRMLVSYDRLQELFCNGRGYWHGYSIDEHTDYDDDTTPIIMAEKRLEQRILDCLKRISSELTAVFSGDPRGYCVRIYRTAEAASKDSHSDSLSSLFYY
jgi:hypothetical protein